MGRVLKLVFATAVAAVLIVAKPLPAAAQGTAQGNSADYARQAESKDKAAQIASIATAVMLMSQCNPPTNILPCILAPIAMMQAGAAGSSAAGAGVSAENHAQGGAKNVDVKRGDGKGDLTFSQLKNDLAKKGAIISEDGKSLSIGGNSYPLDGSGIADGGKSLGLSDKQVAAGKASLEETQAKVSAMQKTDGDVGSGGGGGGSPSSPGGGGDVQYVKTAKPKASLSGMSKNLGNDKIGVAADDIFEMITRRYKAKDAADTFIQK